MENNTNVSSVFERYFNGLAKLGVAEQSVNLLKEKYGEKIKCASIATKKDSGCAYEGSLMNVALKAATNACAINNLLSNEVKVDVKSLSKICFLCMIGASDRLVCQTDKWRQEHLGEMFAYKDNNVAIPTTLHSVAICSECGIGFTSEEIEAMTILDRPADDKQSKYFASLLATIVKSAFEITFAELKTIEKVKAKA